MSVKKRRQMVKRLKGVQLSMFSRRRFENLTIDRCERCRELGALVNEGLHSGYENKENAWLRDWEEHLNMVHAF